LKVPAYFCRSSAQADGRIYYRFGSEDCLEDILTAALAVTAKVILKNKTHLAVGFFYI
jgi:hypothetical protein